MPYEISPEVLAVFGVGLILNVSLALVLTRRGKSDPLLWSFGIGFAVSVMVAWSFNWHGDGWDSVKIPLFLAGVGLPHVMATCTLRLVPIAPFLLRAAVALLVGLIVAPLMPPIGLMLICGFTGDCP